MGREWIRSCANLDPGTQLERPFCMCTTHTFALALLACRSLKSLAS